MKVFDLKHLGKIKILPKRRLRRFFLVIRTLFLVSKAVLDLYQRIKWRYCSLYMVIYPSITKRI